MQLKQESIRNKTLDLGHGIKPSQTPPSCRGQMAIERKSVAKTGGTKSSEIIFHGRKANISSLVPQ
jgi:hypothetical protein